MTAFQVDLVDPQGTILREIEDRRMTRDDVATAQRPARHDRTYAFCLRQQDEVDFALVNRAPKYIKEKAWRLARG